MTESEKMEFIIRQLQEARKDLQELNERLGK